MVRTVTLNNGTRMPLLSWGNMGGPQKALTGGMDALHAGIHHIDSAQIYGTEAEVNGAIKGAEIDRSQVYVTTKLWKFGKTPITPDDIRASVQKSLDALTFIPNLLLIHNPFIPESGKIGEFWAVLEKLVEDGTLKGCSLGVSNFRPVDLEELMRSAKIKPVVNQIEYHPFVLAHVDPVMAVHDKYKIVTQGYASLTPVHRHPTGGPLKSILNNIATKLTKESGIDVDAAGVLILWTVSQGVVCVTSSGSAERIKQMAATERIRDLTKDEIAAIDAAGRKVHFRAWPEHMTTDFPNPDLPEDL